MNLKNIKLGIVLFGLVLGMGGGMNVNAEEELIFTQTDLDNDGIIDDIDPEVIIISSQTLSAGSYIFNNLTLTNNSVLYIDSNLNSSELFKGGELIIKNLTIEPGSSISANERGYTKGPGYPAEGTLWAGSSYGGAGGNNTPESIYGSATQPVDLGSGGYRRGGGAIRLKVADTLINNGIISANGGSTASGGSIYVTANNISGGGSFQANGGGAQATGMYYIGKGGGGRIAIYYEHSSFTGSAVAVSPCKGCSGANGQDGTVGFFEKNIYQCYDGEDNDGDGLADADDPGCHTDSDVTNNNSYNPELDNENLKILSVPYYSQGDTDWCVPTTMSMILKYYGEDVHFWDIAKEWRLERDEAIWPAMSEDDNVEEYFTSHGLSTVIKKDDDINFDIVKNSIDNNNPVFLSIRTGLGYAVVVVGYEIKDGDEIVYINDSSGTLDEKNIGYGRDRIVREVNWNELASYFEEGLWDTGTYIILLQGTPNAPEGTLSDLDYGFNFTDEYGVVRSWTYGTNIGIGWKSENGRIYNYPLLNNGDRMIHNIITNHTEQEQNYLLRIQFSSVLESELSPVLYEYIVNLNGYENAPILRDIDGNISYKNLYELLGNNYGEYIITLTLWGGNDFSEKYDEIVFPNIEYINSDQEDQNKYYMVKESDVNLRAEPTTSSTSTKLLKGWILEEDGLIVQDEEHIWQPVKYAQFDEGIVGGWVAKEFLIDIIGDDLLPVAKPDYFTSSSSRIEEAIEQANDKIGEEWRDSEGDPTCLGFIRRIFNASAKWSCAQEELEDIKKGNMFYEHDSSWNPPKGALVFFSNNDLSSSLSKYGHVGIYIGNGEVIHVWRNGEVEKMNISLIVAGSYSYEGWASPEELFKTYTFTEDNFVGFDEGKNIRNDRTVDNSTFLVELKSEDYVKIIPDVNNGIFHEGYYWWKAKTNKKNEEGEYIEGWFAEGSTISEKIIECPEELDENGWCTKDTVITIKLNSPGDLQVYDLQERISGLVNGERVEDIPNSIYDDENHTVVIFFASPDSYFYKVVGTDTGTYGLTITSVVNGEEAIFNATDIPTTPGEVHQFSINWQALSQGEDGVTMQIDKDGDGDFEKTITSDATLEPPIADAGGPYQSAEGTEITFDASGSTDADGSIVSYEWDFDGDGNYDESSDLPTINYTYGDDYNGEVVLMVTDDEGLTSVDTAEVNITNANPVIEIFDDQTIEVLDEFMFENSFTDAGWLDTHTAEIDWEDGIIENISLTEENEAPEASGEVVGSHIYNIPDTYTVTLTITDDNEGVGADEFSVTVEKRKTELAYTGDINGQYSDKATLQAALTDKLGSVEGKTIDFHLGSQTYSAVTNNEGIAETEITLNEIPGIYEMETSFQEDDFYLSSSDSDEFETMKDDTVLSVPSASIVYSDDATIQVTLRDDENKTLLNQINSQKTVYLEYLIESEWRLITKDALYSTDDTDDVLDFYFQIPDNFDEIAGNYDLRARFSGDDYYNETTSETGNLEVLKEDTILSDPSATVTYSDPSTLEITFQDNDGETLFHQSDEPKTVYLEVLDGAEWKTLSEDSLNSTDNSDNALTFTFEIQEGNAVDLPAGDYELRARFDGDSRYNSTVGNGTLTIIKESVVITVENQEGYFDDTVFLKATVLDDDGEKLYHGPYQANFMVGDNVVGNAVIDEDNNVEINWLVDYIPTELSETYTILVSFAENEYYLPAEGQEEFTLKSAKQLKEDTLAELKTITTDNKQAQKEIAKAIEDIENSLDSELWTDASRIDEQQGHKVFDREKQAIKSLLKIIEEKGKHNNSEIVDELQAIINDFAKVDTLLSKVAIYDAENMETDDTDLQKKIDSEISRAKKELEKALQELANGNPDKAVDYLRKSWESAQLAINFILDKTNRWRNEFENGG